MEKFAQREYLIKYGGKMLCLSKTLSADHHLKLIGYQLVLVLFVFKDTSFTY